MPDRPNVILFITHDTGRFVSPYGVTTVHTPNCERLAAQGVRFANSFCASPLCSTSRAACVTGRYPHQNGVQGLTSPRTGGFDLYPGESHAAQLFARAGYSTVLCGFEHETPHWENWGFQSAISGTGGWFNGGGDLRQHASQFDAWLGRQSSDRPFYMQVGCHETHQEWNAFDTPSDGSLGITMPSYLNNIPDVRREMAEMQGAVRRMDEGLGQMLDVLDQRGLAQNTIFVFTTDHGIDFPRAKGTFYDSGIGVFLFMRYPAGHWGQGIVHTPLISNVDVLPTLLEATNIEVPANIAGRSFLPLLQGKPYEPREMVAAEKTYHDTYDPTRCIRSEQYKYIRYFEVNIFQDLRLATETRRHYFKGDWIRNVVEELYDLHADPDEQNNLAKSPAHQEVLKEMRARLLSWMEQTQDPLLAGPIASPYYSEQLRLFREGGA